MYKNFYGFSEEPFSLSPDPKFLFLARSHFEALSSMMSGIKERKGIIVITGEAGIGKTTLIHALLKDLSEKIKTAFIFQTTVDFQDLLKNILRDLGVAVEAKEDDVRSLIGLFRKYLKERLIRDEIVTIVIDEGQSLDERVLEDLFRLTSPDAPAAKLLQILLVGQLELEAKLNSEKLRPLRERIAVHRQIRPLTREEGRGYLQHRLEVVGGTSSEVFTPEAANRVWEFAEGIPRVMNLLCDRALLIGYNDSRPVIDSRIVSEAMKDFDYLRPRPSGVLRAVYSRIKSHYQIIGIAVLLFLSLGVVSFLLRDSGLLISKVMVKLRPSMERSMGILPSEERPVETRGKILPPEKRARETRKEEIIEVKKGWSLFFVARQYFPAYNTTLLGFILEANPQITDLNLIFPNQKIKIPNITEESLLIRVSDNVYDLHLGTFRSSQDASLYKEETLLRGKKIKIIPRKVSPRETWYRIVVGEFNTKEEALRAIQTLKEKKLLPLLECLPKKTV